MARSWFVYILTTPTDRLISSNYVAIPNDPSCLGTPNNVCAVYATVSSTQPVLTTNLNTYLTAAGISPFQAQPAGNVKRYVYTRPS